MTFIPNAEQTKSIVRWLITAFGGILAGWFAHSGFVTTQQVLDVLNSPMFLSIAVSAVGAVWGLVTHTQGNAVAVVDAIPAVAGVVVKNTGDGHALADAADSHTVAVEGTAAAASVAAK